jgi:hypothetical protein
MFLTEGEHRPQPLGLGCGLSAREFGYARYRLAVYAGHEPVLETSPCVPYGWWAYAPEQMTGNFLKSHGDLQLETVRVWTHRAEMRSVCLRTIDRKRFPSEPAVRGTEPRLLVCKATTSPGWVRVPGMCGVVAGLYPLMRLNVPGSSRWRPMIEVGAPVGWWRSPARTLSVGTRASNHNCQSHHTLLRRR